jgi:hypothetical protein
MIDDGDEDVGHRRSAYAIRRVPAPGPPAPNATVEQITVEVRVFWPPGTSRGDIIQVLTDTVAEAGIAIVRETVDEPLPRIEGRPRMRAEDYGADG